MANAFQTSGTNVKFGSFEDAKTFAAEQGQKERDGKTSRGVFLRDFADLVGSGIVQYVKRTGRKAENEEDTPVEEMCVAYVDATDSKAAKNDGTFRNLLSQMNAIARYAASGPERAVGDTMDKALEARETALADFASKKGRRPMDTAKVLHAVAKFAMSEERGKSAKPLTAAEIKECLFVNKEDRAFVDRVTSARKALVADKNVPADNPLWDAAVKAIDAFIASVEETKEAEKAAEFVESKLDSLVNAGAAKQNKGGSVTISREKLREMIAAAR